MRSIVYKIAILAIAVALTSSIVIGGEYGYGNETAAEEDYVYNTTTNETADQNESVSELTHDKIVDQMVVNAYNQSIDVYQPISTRPVNRRNEYYQGTDDITIEYPGNCTVHSLEDIIRFLAEDDTETTIYEIQVYDCTQFSEDVINKALEKGILAYPATIEYLNANAHAVVAFPTKENGYVYIDCTGTPKGGLSQYDDRIITQLIPGKVYEKYWLHRDYLKTSDKIVREVFIYRPAGMEFPRNFDETSQTYTW